VAGGLDTEGEGGDVEEEEVLGLLVTLAGEDSTLDGGTVGDGLIGVEGTAELLATEVLDERRLDLGDTGGTTDEDDIVDVLGVHVGILHDLADGLDTAREDRLGETLELGTGKGVLEVLLGEESLNSDGGGLDGGKLALGLLDGEHEAALGAGVLVDVGEAHGGEDLLEDVLGDEVINILTTKTGVTTSGLDLEDAVVNLEDGNIEGTTTKIEDKNGLGLGVDVDGLAIKTISKSSSGGLVDDTENLKTSNLTGVLGSSTLGVVEVGGDGDDGLVDGEAEVGLGSLLEVTKNHTRDLLRGEDLSTLLSLDLDTDLVGASLTLDDGVRVTLHVLLDTVVVETKTDETLDVVDGVLGVAGSLKLGGHTDVTLAAGVEGDIGGGSHVTTIVGDDGNRAVVPEGNARVGGTEINTDDDILGLDSLVVFLLLLGSEELLSSSKTIVARLVKGVDLETGLESLLGITELLEGHKSSTLADVSLDVLGLELDSLVSILNSLGKELNNTSGIEVLRELELASRTVGVSLSVLGVSLNSLSEVLEGSREIVLGESILAHLIGVGALILDRLHDCWKKKVKVETEVTS
jgi:hypothetical protein